MQLNDFHYALSLAEELYGITMQEDSFEEVGLIAWNQIGNKLCRIYRYHKCFNPCVTEMELPCNADYIEAVTTDFEDFQHVSNIHNWDLPGSFQTEAYIESQKRFKHPLYMSGKFIKYEQVGNTLYFSEPQSHVNVLYRGVELDEEGLPRITDKEALAIATFCAYTVKFKETIVSGNPNALKLSEMLQQKWRVQCDQARVPENVSQNEWNDILDARSSWNRKLYGKSYKPLR